MNIRDRIVVVGGYGQVGQTICNGLSKLYPGKVYAAGRSLERAERFSRATGGKVKPLKLDVRGELDPHILERTKLVVMCLDQTDTRFIRDCFANGIHYVDISADYSFLAQAEQCHAAAIDGRASAVLSVGLAPGLTNLMARHAQSLLDRADRLDISILLGLGDRHGRAAIEWTIDNLNGKYKVVQGGGEREVASFTDGRTTDFGAKLGRRKAYRFNFSDQHVLPRTLGIPSVSTRLCFDSAAVTRGLAGLKATGVLRLLKYGPVRQAAIGGFGRIRLGKDGFAVKIDVGGVKEGRQMMAECLVQGRNEAAFTGRIAAAVAAALYRSEYPPGVHHIEQLFELESVLDAMGGTDTAETKLSEADSLV